MQKWGLVLILLNVIFGLVLPDLVYSAQTHIGIFDGSAITPSNFTIFRGDTVYWQNTSASEHLQISSDPHPGHDLLPWLNLGPANPNGGAVGMTFTEVGTYTYHDHIHPNLRGAITVQSVPTDTPVPTPTLVPTAIPTIAPSSTPLPEVTVPQYKEVPTVVVRELTIEALPSEIVLPVQTNEPTPPVLLPQVKHNPFFVVLFPVIFFMICGVIYYFLIIHRHPHHYYSIPPVEEMHKTEMQEEFDTQSKQ